MKILKQPWFLILVLVAGIYTYQFYNSPKSFQFSTNKAQATSQTQEETTVDEGQGRISVKTSQSFKASRIKNFELATYLNLDVKFSQTSGDELIVSLIGEGKGYKNKGQMLKDWFDIKVSSKTLKISSPSKKSFKNYKSMKELAKTISGDNDNTLTMIVEFPENFYFKDINLEGVTTDVVGSQMQFKNFNVASVSGDLSLKNSKGENIEVETVSGDNTIEMSDLKVAEFSSVSGDTTLKALNTTPKVKFSSVSGDMDLKIPSDGKINVDFESMTGDLENDFGTAGSKGSSIEFSSLSGDASISKIK